jgi:hypothetical protein
MSLAMVTSTAQTTVASPSQPEERVVVENAERRDGGIVPSESFHPTREGFQLYGEVFTAALRELGL